MPYTFEHRKPSTLHRLHRCLKLNITLLAVASALLLVGCDEGKAMRETVQVPMPTKPANADPGLVLLMRADGNVSAGGKTAPYADAVQKLVPAESMRVSIAPCPGVGSRDVQKVMARLKARQIVVAMAPADEAQCAATR